MADVDLANQSFGMQEAMEETFAIKNPKMNGMGIININKEPLQADIISDQNSRVKSQRTSEMLDAD